MWTVHFSHFLSWDVLEQQYPCCKSLLPLDIQLIYSASSNPEHNVSCKSVPRF